MTETPGAKRFATFLAFGIMVWLVGVIVILLAWVTRALIDVAFR